VKYFDPRGKSATYHFDDQTDSLNIAGWTYNKSDAAAVPAAPAAEPTLR
jgi:hypothetical protein